MAKATEENQTTNTVRTTDLASEYGYEPAYLRKILREGVAQGKIEHEPRTRWEWEEGSANLNSVRSFLSEYKEQAEREAAEAENEDDDEELDDEDFDDE